MRLSSNQLRSHYSTRLTPVIKAGTKRDQALKIAKIRGSLRIMNAIADFLFNDSAIDCV